MGVGKFHAVLAVIAAAILALSAYAMHQSRIAVLPSQWLPRLILLAALLAGAAFYRWRRMERAVNLILMAFWAILLSNLLFLPMYVAARRRVEASDALLARWDAALGVEVPDVLRVMERFPAVAGFLAASYDTLIVLVTLAIVVPPLCGRMDKAKEYALAVLAAAAIALPLFAAFQAEGPWCYYGYPPSPPQAECTQMYRALKTDEWYVLDLSSMNGLICFPSFHTILAVLAASALWPIPYLRWPAAVAAGLIVLATVTTGWHYLADVIGGLLIAAASVAVARGYLWLEARGGRRQERRPEGGG
jgi:hypothetical protein